MSKIQDNAMSEAFTDKLNINFNIYKTYPYDDFLWCDLENS